MKKYFAMIAAFVLMLGLMAGCRGRMDEDMNTTGDTNMDNSGTMLPPIEDTVDPTNGANRETGHENTPSETADNHRDEPQATNDNADPQESTPARGRRRMFPIP